MGKERRGEKQTKRTKRYPSGDSSKVNERIGRKRRSHSKKKIILDMKKGGYRQEGREGGKWNVTAGGVEIRDLWSSPAGFGQGKGDWARGLRRGGGTWMQVANVKGEKEGVVGERQRTQTGGGLTGRLLIKTENRKKPESWIKGDKKNERFLKEKKKGDRGQHG